jgi:diguanylate cyclase (GGDEF)-like protein
MMPETRTYSLPRWHVTRWLAYPGHGVTKNIRVTLIGALFGSLPVFAGGIANTLLVSAVIAARMQTAPFIAWFVIEIVICTARLVVLVMARRAAFEHRQTPTDIYMLLSVAWSSNVGYGVVISLASGDWVAATLACLSAAAMVGGICFRNFSAPRLAGTMILTSLGPCLPGAVLAGEPVLYVVFAQVPMYLVAMTIAAFKLNKMLIATMRAERQNERRARHDPLTGLSNRAGFLDDVNARLADTSRKAEGLALLFLDLDGFKSVNDTYGHACGDRLLKMVASRLRRVVRPADLVARIGGDEFLVLAEGLAQEPALELGRRLINEVATSYDLGEGISTEVGVSVGIAMAPEHGTDFATLVEVADAALYEAKSQGKMRCSMGSPMPLLAATRRLRGKVESMAGMGTEAAA